MQPLSRSHAWPIMGPAQVQQLEPALQALSPTPLMHSAGLACARLALAVAPDEAPLRAFELMLLRETGVLPDLGRATTTQALVLASTELVMLVDPDANVLPIFDSTRIHCDAAANWILEQEVVN